ncbi:LytR/AlgR family response regulator transcription factor [Roseivirga sp.]|uniref:LytR/AlgR family response regulator transcription factor n=1 Tax=Roseivirga sp. TaxID=1964215 RepID=UPI003B8D74B5
MQKTSSQIIFWILIFVFLNIVFGSKWGNYGNSFYYTSMLMPVAQATSYFFNLFLVPKYLSQGKYFKFGLYTIYTIIVSVFFSAVVSIVSFIILADLNWNEMNPAVTDLFQLGIIIYFVAILFSFIHTYSSDKKHRIDLSILEANNEKNLQKTIRVKSNRKILSINISDILYIESLADYVKLHTLNEVIITKEKISTLEKTLPSWFIRIHRSYLIDQNRLNSYGHDFVELNSTKLPIGRKYKKEAIEKFEERQVS